MSYALDGSREYLICDRCGHTIGEAQSGDGDAPHYCERCEPFEEWLWEAALTVEALIEQRARAKHRLPITAQFAGAGSIPAAVPITESTEGA